MAGEVRNGQRQDHDDRDQTKRLYPTRGSLIVFQNNSFKIITASKLRVCPIAILAEVGKGFAKLVNFQNGGFRMPGMEVRIHRIEVLYSQNSGSMGIWISLSNWR